MQAAPETATETGGEAPVDPIANASPAPVLLDVFGRRWLMTFHGLDESVVTTLRHLWARATVPDEPDPAHGIPASLGSAGEAEPFPVMAGESDRPSGVAETDGVIVGTDDESIPYSVSRALTLQAITRRRGEALMLHAVGLCGDNGRAVALVAPSGTGKTTAAKKLGRHLGYLSDETVIIEADDRISAYPKPLSIITNPGESWSKHEESPDDLELLHPDPDGPPPTIAAVVVLRRDAELSAPTFTMHPLVDAILDVIPETSALPSLPDPLDRLCRVLTKSGGPFLLTHPDITGCVDLIVALTEPDPARDAQAPTWTHHPGPPPPPPVVEDFMDKGPPYNDEPPEPGAPITRTPIEWGSVVVRGRWTDCIVAEGEAVLLRDLIPVRLSRLGTILWESADQPTTVAALHEQVVALIGSNEESADLVVKAVQLLVDNALLRIDG